MELTTFTEKDFDQLIGWINSPELNYLWGGPSYKFPLTRRQITRHCRQREVSPFLFQVNGENIGFVELYRISPQHYRICRVFISDDYRGQGLSKQMLMLLSDKARTEFGCLLLSLAVFGHNQIARRSYESLGFKVTAIEKGTRSYGGEMWDLVRMEKWLTESYSV
ncbi:GNAT family N-acetyltransferase [Vibrio quintilis]|uniref:Spermidine N(1)-acetyltransferase n=1 Tax=Vibrio quintilis TaxID=1117707 RepID=A0A1M7YP43_9VIBR|nr:GNAT family protein [Vibrio quintilis]SHO54355.1 Spermidine N(1)-acetyltransferase [Vibrio quintilis]